MTRVNKTPILILLLRSCFHYNAIIILKGGEVNQPRWDGLVVHAL